MCGCGARGMLDGADLSRDACLEIAARMQCAPRPSVQVLNQLTAAFYTIAERELIATREARRRDLNCLVASVDAGTVPSKADVARRMNADDVGRWFSETMRVDANGLGPIHRDLLAVLSKRGAVSEDEIRRSLGISNRNDFVEVVEYLTRLGLIKVGPGGRSLTGAGRRYMLDGRAIGPARPDPAPRQWLIRSHLERKADA